MGRIGLLYSLTPFILRTVLPARQTPPIPEEAFTLKQQKQLQVKGTIFQINASHPGNVEVE